MLARVERAVTDGAWRYPRLYWECGQIGQLLYLEAEAAGLSGTGIGCYFDDACGNCSAMPTAAGKVFTISPLAALYGMNA